jgi:3-phenylpropionate/trans-cinnamate dioxygenase ferredoxin reductase component
MPFFWSDQYDRKIQFLGRAGDGDDVEVVVGTEDERRFVALYHRHGRLTAALGIGMPKHLMRFRALVLEHATIEAGREHAAAMA